MAGRRINCEGNQDPCKCLEESACLLPSFKEDLCNRIKPAQISSNVLENVLDIASTLVDILQMCGIHECKATRALDVIIYAFMHFDEVAEHPGGKCKKRIRKEDFKNDLTRDCGMTKADMKLTYSIVKCAFKAFYHKQVLNKYNMALVDECLWRSAASKTVSIFAHSGATKSQIELTGRRILSAYENFICRLQARSSRKGLPVNPCVCSPPMPSRPCRHSTDPCKPEYLQPCQPPDPPLCAQLQCQFVCPPGANYPQIICKDPCGRLFLKVDGDTICFDPLILECEARRAAMDICPPSNAERIKALRECIKTCMPKDTDSCDEKLAEIAVEDEDDYERLKRDMEGGSQNESEASDEEVALDDTDAEGKVVKIDDHKKRHSEEDDKGEEKLKDDGMGKTDEDTDEIDKDKDEIDKDKDDKDDTDSDEEDDDGVAPGFFISADLHTLENGKRKLDVKVRGKCPKSQKLINSLNELHVKGNHEEEMWYELTPLSGPAIEIKDVSKGSSQASHAISKQSQMGDSDTPSQELNEEKLHAEEPADKDVDQVPENEQDSAEPAENPPDDKISNVDEPANENEGDE